MTPKQQRFVDEYLVDLNGTQAAIRAGYSPAAAKEQAYRLLTKAHILDAVARGKQDLSQRVQVTQEDVIGGLVTEAKGDGPDSTSASRVRAWELLARHLGLLDDAERRAANQVPQVQLVEVVLTHERDGSVTEERREINQGPDVERPY